MMAKDFNCFLTTQHNTLNQQCSTILSTIIVWGVKMQRKNICWDAECSKGIWSGCSSFCTSNVYMRSHLCNSPLCFSQGIEPPEKKINPQWTEGLSQITGDLRFYNPRSLVDLCAVFVCLNGLWWLQGSFFLLVLNDASCSFNYHHNSLIQFILAWTKTSAITWLIILVEEWDF